MLKVKHICKNFGLKSVLNDIDFTLKKGEITALLGENGAGKSTLLRIMSGFISPTSGSVEIPKSDIFTQRQSYLQQIGYVQEISSLYGYMLAYDFLDFMAELRGLSGQDKIKRLQKIIKEFSLSEVLTQKTLTLSKGYKKRLEIAASLLSEPEVLLLDEPTEGLDPNQKNVLREIIKNYAKNHIVMISTHTLEDVEVLAQRIILLHQGKIYSDTAIADFKKISGKSLLQSFQKITNK